MAAIGFIETTGLVGNIEATDAMPVSYTHLDVYKRQRRLSLPREPSPADRWIAAMVQKPPGERGRFSYKTNQSLFMEE